MLLLQNYLAHITNHAQIHFIVTYKLKPILAKNYLIIDFSRRKFNLFIFILDLRYKNPFYLFKTPKKT